MRVPLYCYDRAAVKVVLLWTGSMACMFEQRLLSCSPRQTAAGRGAPASDSMECTHRRVVVVRHALTSYSGRSIISVTTAPPRAARRRLVRFAGGRARASMHFYIKTTLVPLGTVEKSKLTNAGSDAVHACSLACATLQ